MSSPDGKDAFESLPARYQQWVEVLLPHGIPRESVATCMDCVMCASCDADAPVDPQYFNPGVKCCSYFPVLPNYLAGEAMHADTPGGAALRAFVDTDNATAAVTLTGVAPSAETSAKYAGHGGEAFGRDASLLCPYAIEAGTAEGPLCGIWQHRNAVCSTYFCKHVRGATGHRFWQSIRNLFLEVEQALTWWCIAECIPDAGRRLLQSPADDTRRVGLRLIPNAWAHWPDSRAAFYEACASHVGALQWDEVLAIAGIKARLHTGEVHARYEELCSMAVPARLRAAAYTVIHEDGPRTVIESAAHREHLATPTVLLPLLRYFDGRAVDEVLDAIQTSENIELDTGLVRRLYDFGILEPVDQ